MRLALPLLGRSLQMDQLINVLQLLNIIHALRSSSHLWNRRLPNRSPMVSQSATAPQRAVTISMGAHRAAAEIRMSII